MPRSIGEGGAWRQVACCLAGYALMKLWMWLSFWAPAFTSGFLSAIAGPVNPYALSLAANTVALGALIVGLSSGKPLVDRAHPAVWACALMSAGCVLLSFNAWASEPRGMLYGIGSVSTGVGSAVMLVLWGEALAGLRTRQALVCLIGASVAAGLAAALLVLGPQVAVQAATVACPVGSAALLGRGLHEERDLTGESWHAAGADEDASPKVPEVLAAQSTARPDADPHQAAFPLRLAAVVLFFGLTFGLMRGLLSSEEMVVFVPGGSLGSALNMIACACAGVVVYVTAVVLRLDYRSLTYKITLPLIALGFMFLTFQNMKPFAMPMHTIGFQYFYIILWSVMAFNGAREDTPAGWLFACGMFCLQVGQTAGATAGAWLAAVFGSGMLSTVVELALFGMVLVCLFFLPDGSLGYTAITPGALPILSGTENMTRSREQVIAMISSRHGLSARESEVFALLAMRYDRPGICAALTIGDETAKTHIKHIYQKLGIHSRSELQELVARESEQIRKENYGL